MGRLLKFLFGLAIGAGAALLVTPKTGREVREMLAGPQVRGLMPTRLAELTRPRDEAQTPGTGRRHSGGRTAGPDRTGRRARA